MPRTKAVRLRSNAKVTGLPTLTSRSKPSIGPCLEAQIAAATVIAPTYYPGTADRAWAQVITLAPAETRAGVQFAMVSRTAHHFSGIVVDEGGAGCGRDRMLRIDPRADGAPTPAAGVTDEVGAF